MQGAATVNARWDIAERLIAAFDTVPNPPTSADHVTELEWQLAASLARTPIPDEETRRIVGVKLTNQHSDPFAGLPEVGF